MAWIEVNLSLRDNLSMSKHHVAWAFPMIVGMLAADFPSAPGALGTSLRVFWFFLLGIIGGKIIAWYDNQVAERTLDDFHKFLKGYAKDDER